VKLSDIEYIERYVAFLDILGFREMVNADEPEKTIALLENFFERARELAGIATSSKLTYKLFSDCICVSTPVDVLGVFNIIQYIAHFQVTAFQNGIFVRGGLSVGKHYESERMIFSEGLVNAYKLEQKAFYPRIVIDKSITKPREPGNIHCNNTIMYAPDNSAFIDYMGVSSIYLMDHSEKLQALFDTHREQILKQMEGILKKPDDPKNANKIAKYMWLADYHNTKCNQFIEDNPNLGVDRNLLIDRSELPEFH
jgi:hypothetical protein